MAILNSAVSACETGAQWQVAIQLLTEGAFAKVAREPPGLVLGGF